MLVKFNIVCNDPKSMSNILLRDSKDWQDKEAFFFNIQEVDEKGFIGEVNFPNDYNTSDFLLKIRSEDLIKNILFSYSFSNNEQYKLEFVE